MNKEDESFTKSKTKGEIERLSKSEKEFATL